jgi:hypothetical protein
MLRRFLLAILLVFFTSNRLVACEEKIEIVEGLMVLASEEMPEETVLRELSESLFEGGFGHIVFTDINSLDSGLRALKETPLFLAVYLGRLDIVKKLFDLEVEINFEDEFGLSALGVAIDNHNDELIAFLLQHGADFNVDCEKKLSLIADINFIKSQISRIIKEESLMRKSISFCRHF